MKLKLQKIIPLLLVLTACNRVPVAGELNPEIIPSTPTLPGVPVATPTPPKQSDTNPLPPVSTGAKIALVYAGPGVCEEDCATSAAESARLAGLTPRLIYPNSLTNTATQAQVDALYQDAVVWIEPGGYARNSWQGMSQKMQTTLKEFVRTGGGYVGFCAGAFMATQEIGSTGASGLGIFPGKTYPYSGSMIEKINWLGVQKSIYWEGGPYFYNLDSSVEVIGLYKDGTVAAARTQFGSGRVYLSGPHPEAPGWWSNQAASSRVSGPTQQIAADMIKWSARIQ